MRLYLDEDSSAAVLVSLLQRAGHDVEVGPIGDKDPEVLRCAILLKRVLLSHNHDDFKDLHDLIAAARGAHEGILIVRKDNDPTRDLSSRGIAHAIDKLVQSGLSIGNEFHVLNQWR